MPSASKPTPRTQRRVKSKGKLDTTVDVSTLLAPDDIFAKVSEYCSSYASNETILLVGLTILMWSELETEANKALALMIIRPKSQSDLDIQSDLIDRTVIACAGKDIRASLGAMKSIVGLENPEHYADFHHLQERIQSAYVNKRNVIAHRRILTENKKGRVTFDGLKTIGRVTNNKLPFTRDQLWQLALEFIQYKLLLISFVRRLGLHYPDSAPSSRKGKAR